MLDTQRSLLSAAGEPVEPDELDVVRTRAKSRAPQAGEPGWDRPVLPPGVRRGTVKEFIAQATKGGGRVIDMRSRRESGS